MDHLYLKWSEFILRYNLDFFPLNCSISSPADHFAPVANSYCLLNSHTWLITPAHSSSPIVAYSSLLYYSEWPPATAI